jgi:ABC-type multidrug transport system ATPase subunit
MILLEKLRKKFDELLAVNDIEVSIPEAETYGLTGPNGAGKISTIRMACGLLEPTGGRVSIADVLGQ